MELENADQVMVTKLTRTEREQLEYIAERERRTKSNMIRKIICEYLEDYEVFTQLEEE